MLAVTDKQYLVVSAVGPDRPGLVSELSATLRARGANLEDSRMAILGGEFALLMLVAGSSATLEALGSELPALGQRLALTVLTKPTQRRSNPSEHISYRLKVAGVDHPGIVERVSSLLAERLINVESLDSRIAYAPLSGTPMFLLEATLQVPTETALSRLRGDLSSLAEQDNLDITLQAQHG
jgi:glycine cleavage system transcriptional repressor